METIIFQQLDEARISGILGNVANIATSSDLQNKSINWHQSNFTVVSKDTSTSTIILKSEDDCEHFCQILTYTTENDTEHVKFALLVRKITYNGVEITLTSLRRHQFEDFDDDSIDWSKSKTDTHGNCWDKIKYLRTHDKICFFENFMYSGEKLKHAFAAMIQCAWLLTNKIDNDKVSKIKNYDKMVSNGLNKEQLNAQIKTIAQLQPTPAYFNEIFNNVFQGTLSLFDDFTLQTEVGEADISSVTSTVIVAKSLYDKNHHFICRFSMKYAMDMQSKQLALEEQSSYLSNTSAITYEITPFYKITFSVDSTMYASVYLHEPEKVKIRLQKLFMTIKRAVTMQNMCKEYITSECAAQATEN